MFQDQVFTYVMPPGWSVSGENQNGIILNLGDTADVTYLLAEVVPASQAGSARDHQVLPRHDRSHQRPHSLGDEQPEPDRGHRSGPQTAFEEFTGTIKGVSDHGLIYGTADTGSGLTSGPAWRSRPPAPGTASAVD